MVLSGGLSQAPLLRAEVKNHNPLILAATYTSCQLIAAWFLYYFVYFIFDLSAQCRTY